MGNQDEIRRRSKACLSSMLHLARRVQAACARCLECGEPVITEAKVENSRIGSRVLDVLEVINHSHSHSHSLSYVLKQSFPVTCSLLIIDERKLTRVCTQTHHIIT